MDKFKITLLYRNQTISRIEAKEPLEIGTAIKIKGIMYRISNAIINPKTFKEKAYINKISF